MYDPADTLTLYIDWTNPDGSMWLQEYREVIDPAGEQATVQKVIEQLTSVDQLYNRRLKSVKAVKTDRMDSYKFEQVSQPLYRIIGYEVAQ